MTINMAAAEVFGSIYTCAVFSHRMSWVGPGMVSVPTYTVDPGYLDFGYLEQPLISKRKSDLCLNIEIYHQVTKYNG